MTATQAQFRERLAETANTGPWRGVYFDGPQPDQDPEGEDHNSRSERHDSGNHLVAGLGSQIPVWVVYVGDEEAEPVSTVYHVYNFARAQALAERMSRDRRLELIHDATTA